MEPSKDNVNDIEKGASTDSPEHLEIVSTFPGQLDEEQKHDVVEAGKNQLCIAQLWSLVLRDMARQSVLDGRLNSCASYQSSRASRMAARSALAQWRKFACLQRCFRESRCSSERSSCRPGGHSSLQPCRADGHRSQSSQYSGRRSKLLRGRPEPPAPGTSGSAPLSSECEKL